MRTARPAPMSAITVVGVLWFALPAARADDAFQKPVATLVKAVRYSQDDKALKQLDGDAEGRVLLGEDWAKGTAEQRSEFISLFHKLFAALAFPKIKDNLQNLGTIVYDKPVISGDMATLESTLAIDHPLKKEEIRVKYDMHKTKDGWKVIDVTSLGVGGASMLRDFVKPQLDPVMKDGGWAKVLDVMRKRLADVQKK